MYVYLPGEFSSSCLLRENPEVLYSPSLHGKENFGATFQGQFWRDWLSDTSLQLILSLLLPGLHQIIPRASQTLQHAAIKLPNRIHGWTHIWAGKTFMEESDAHYCWPVWVPRFTWTERSHQSRQQKVMPRFAFKPQVDVWLQGLITLTIIMLWGDVDGQL